MVKIYKCEHCHYETMIKHSYESHLSSRRHINTVAYINQTSQSVPTVPTTTVVADFVEHFVNSLTQAVDEVEENMAATEPATLQLPCRKCQRIFTSRSGRWKHESTCTYVPPPPVLDASYIANSIQDLRQEVQELHEELQEHRKEFQELRRIIEATTTYRNEPPLMNHILHTSSNPVVVNTLSYDVSFNELPMDRINATIQYLNTHCKDAMTVEEFVANVTFGIEDYQVIIESDKALDGAKILLSKHLGSLPVEKRPIHCMNIGANLPGIYFVKKNGEWAYETQDTIEFTLLTRGEKTPLPCESGLKMVNLIVEYTRKLSANPPTDVIQRIIHYLNTHHKDAMTMDEFLESITFKADDYREVENSATPIEGIKTLLDKHLRDVSHEKRPLHCIPAVGNRPAVFFVKNNREWTFESRDAIDSVLRREDTVPW